MSKKLEWVLHPKGYLSNQYTYEKAINISHHENAKPFCMR